MFILSGFSATEAYPIPEFALCRRLVRFAVICTNTACRTDQLTDQRLCDCCSSNRLTEYNQRFAESSSQLLQIERRRLSIRCPHAELLFCSSFVIRHSTLVIGHWSFLLVIPHVRSLRLSVRAEVTQSHERLGACVFEGHTIGSCLGCNEHFVFRHRSEADHAWRL